MILFNWDIEQSDKAGHVLKLLFDDGGTVYFLIIHNSFINLFLDFESTSMVQPKYGGTPGTREQPINVKIVIKSGTWNR